MSYVPDDLQRRIDDVLAMARAVDGAVADLCERFTEVSSEYNTAKHPSLADPDRPGDLDPDLHDASGLREADALLIAIRERAYAAMSDGLPDASHFHAYGLHGPGLDDYEPEPVKTMKLLDWLEQAGHIMQIEVEGQ